MKYLQIILYYIEYVCFFGYEKKLLMDLWGMLLILHTSKNVKTTCGYSLLVILMTSRLYMNAVCQQFEKGWLYRVITVWDV